MYFGSRRIEENNRNESTVIDVREMAGEKALK